MHLLPVVLTTLLAAVAAQNIDFKPRLRLLKYQINNNTEATWKSKLGSFNYTQAHMQSLVGAMDFPDGFDPTVNKTTSFAPNRLLQSASYPAALNLSEKYPDCASLRFIPDQGNCASCWAHSSAAAIADNLCIASANAGQKKSVIFSAEDMLECCPYCTLGEAQKCSNGYVFFGYKWSTEMGLVTGGNFGDSRFCKNYFYPPDSNVLLSPPTCQDTCNNPIYPAKYADDKFKTKGFTFNRGTANMVADLNRFGSVTTVIPIYDDFYTYKSGVYKRYSNRLVGTHAIRVIGYGVDPTGGAYWLCVNTWGKSWGENGMFRIRKGVNELTIETGFYFVAQV